MRRNAWFNVAKLGALPRDYLVDFYGPMPDDINRADESDRLHIQWDLQSQQPPPSPDVATLPTVLACEGDAPVAQVSTADYVLVATPPDIEDLRRRHPALARAWRLALREALTSEMSHGHVIGFTQAGEYLVRRGQTLSGI